MSELKPGRELDALIAEKVIGLDVQRDQVTRHWLADKKADDPVDYFIGKTNDRVPHYSTDIAVAWPVSEKLRLCLVPWGESQWTAFQIGHWYEDAERFASDTAAGAICRCALDAVGVTP